MSLVSHLENLKGFIVSCRGIEVDPAKVKEIMEMLLPKTLRRLHSLQGKLESICQFIAQLVDKCYPFAHLLGKDTKFKWDYVCQKAFDNLKEYLASPLVLMS